MSDSVAGKASGEGRGAFTAALYHRWSDVPAAWTALAHETSATPFQNPVFLAAWYQSFCHNDPCQPVIVALAGADGTPALLFPLVSLRDRGLRVVCFADAGVSDNNAPLLGPAAPTSPGTARRAIEVLRKALPGHDLLRFDKIPQKIGSRPNPLALLAGVTEGPLNAHPLHFADDFSDYVRSRAKKFRKEQARVWRVFQRLEGARFDIIADPVEAQELFATFERLQSERIRGLGQEYSLDEPEYRDFYRRLLAEGIRAGTVVFGALRLGSELIGGLIGIANKRSLVFVRLGHAGDKWGFCSPGRLVIERVLEWAHGAGYRDIDFSVGDYDYKRDFCIGSERLLEYARAGSLKGVAAAGLHYAKGVARGSPQLRALVARLRGSGRSAAPQARSLKSAAQG
ncbi:GNAT family N-acetyltransferase [Candidatus Raskinella chloraquaticus]|uniref:BioF2-like acetyltransferase domain-containing protein n=1 Tax=Candidatus Raskinella chloraquaticus TaxID=1951219 RepID=A0A1W9HZT1_9HYPH|nr:MAG: hypothetical protein A4S15_07890 [Proteobacteria bacterium SG_bin8]